MKCLRTPLIVWLVAALGTLAHAQDPQSPVTSGSAQSEFVTRKGTHFYLRDKPYYFAATNRLTQLRGI